MIQINPRPPLDELKAVRSQADLRKILERYKLIWKPVTWDEAISFIAKRIKEILDEAGWDPRQEDGFY